MKKGIFIKIGVLLALFVVGIAVWFFANDDSYAETVIYEHDKLFHEFIATHEFEGEPIGDEEVVVVSSSGKIKVRYRSDQFLLFECENGYNSFYPKIYGVDKNGNWVCDFAICDGSLCHYDPYSKEMFGDIYLIESSADKLVFDVLLMQTFFRANSELDLASFITVEDFEALYAEDPELWGNYYTYIDPERMTREDYDRVWGEDGTGIPGFKNSMLLKPYYLKRRLSRGIPVELFVEKGYDSDFMRRLESRFVRKGYEVPMVLARFTIDISGDEPILDMELLNNISPKNSRVADIIIENYQPEYLRS